MDETQAGEHSAVVAVLPAQTGNRARWWRCLPGLPTASTRFQVIFFVVWSIPVLVTITLLMPPWMVSDEPFHMLRAVHVAHGHILGYRYAPGQAGGFSDPAIYEAFMPIKGVAFQVDTQLSRAMLDRANTVEWRSPSALAWFANTVQYPPFFYLPDAASYWIGRAFDLRVDATLIVARLANAVVFVAISAAAIVKSERIRPIVMAILMLPMPLVLAASASQDALLIPVAAWIAAAFDSAEAHASWSRRDAAMVCIGLVALGTARPPYAVLTILLLDRSSPRRFLLFACSCVAIAVWCVVVARTAMVPIGPSDPIGQWHSIRADPWAIPLVVRNTIAEIGIYWWEFIGRLAWNDRPLPQTYLWCASGTLCLAAQATMQGPGKPNRIALAAICLSVLAIFTLQYFDWTAPGTTRVEGVVGRYFIPLALFLPLSFPSIAFLQAWRNRAAYVSIAAMAAVTPAVIAHHLVLRFYMR